MRERTYGPSEHVNETEGPIRKELQEALTAAGLTKRPSDQNIALFDGSYQNAQAGGIPEKEYQGYIRDAEGFARADATAGKAKEAQYWSERKVVMETLLRISQEKKKR